MKIAMVTSLLLVSCLLAPPFGALARPPSTETGSARKFVQDFYVWYQQEQKKDHQQALSTVAFETRPQWFSAAIVEGLREDDAAAAKSPDEVVGLDFDPFTNSQEDCGPYTTGKVVSAGKTYRVEVFGSCPGTGSRQPDVIAAVEKIKGSWVFVDFYYPGHDDLFSVLKELKKEREGNAKTQTGKHDAVPLH